MHFKILIDQSKIATKKLHKLIIMFYYSRTDSLRFKYFSVFLIWASLYSCIALKDAPLKDGKPQEQALESGQVVVRKSMTQAQAFSFCEQRSPGGRLAVLPQAEDAQNLIEAIKKISNEWTNDDDPAQFTYEFHMSRRYWIGLMDVTREGDWIWSKDGTSLNYEDMWYSGQPDHILKPDKSKDEHCVTLWNPIFYEKETHTFNDENCENKHYFICEDGQSEAKKAGRGFGSNYTVDDGSDGTLPAGVVLEDDFTVGAMVPKKILHQHEHDYDDEGEGEGHHPGHEDADAEDIEQPIIDEEPKTTGGHEHEGHHPHDHEGKAQDEHGEREDNPKQNELDSDTTTGLKDNKSANSTKEKYKVPLPNKNRVIPPKLDKMPTTLDKMGKAENDKSDENDSNEKGNQDKPVAGNGVKKRAEHKEDNTQTQVRANGAKETSQSSSEDQGVLENDQQNEITIEQDDDKGKEGQPGSEESKSTISKLHKDLRSTPTKSSTHTRSHEKDSRSSKSKDKSENDDYDSASFTRQGRSKENVKPDSRTKNIERVPKVKVKIPLPKKDRATPPKLHHVPTMLDKMPELQNNGGISYEHNSAEEVNLKKPVSATTVDGESQDETNDELKEAMEKESEIQDKVDQNQEALDENEQVTADDIPNEADDFNGAAEENAQELGQTTEKDLIEMNPESAKDESETDQKDPEELDKAVNPENQIPPSDQTEEIIQTQIPTKGNKLKGEKPLIPTKGRVSPPKLHHIPTKLDKMTHLIGADSPEQDDHVATPDQTQEIERTNDELPQALDLVPEQGESKSDLEELYKKVETENQVAPDQTHEMGQTDDEHSHGQDPVPETGESRSDLEESETRVETEADVGPSDQTHEIGQTDDEHSHAQESVSEKAESQADQKDTELDNKAEPSKEILEQTPNNLEITQLEEDQDNNEIDSKPEADNRKEPNGEKITDVSTMGSQVKGGKPIIPKKDKVGPPKLHHIPTKLDKMTHLIGADSPEQDDHVATPDQTQEIEQTNDELPQAVDLVPVQGASNLEELNKKGESESELGELDKKVETENQVAPSDQTHEMGQTDDEHSHAQDSVPEKGESTPDLEELDKKVETENQVAPSDQTHEMGQTDDEHSHAQESVPQKGEPEPNPEGLESKVKTEAHVAPSDQTYEIEQTNDDHFHAQDSVPEKGESQSDQNVQEEVDDKTETEIEISETKAQTIENPQRDEQSEKYNIPEINNQEDIEKNTDIPAKGMQQNGGKPIIPKKDRVSPPKLHHILTKLDKMTHLIGADSPEQDDLAAPIEELPQESDSISGISESVQEKGESESQGLESVPETLDSESEALDSVPERGEPESDTNATEDLDKKVETEDHVAPSDQTHEMGETNDEHSHSSSLTVANEQSEAKQTPNVEKPVETEENVAETDATRHINDDEHSHKTNLTVAKQQSEIEPTPDKEKNVETEENVAETDATRHINDDEHSHSSNSTVESGQSKFEETPVVENPVEVETEEHGKKSDATELTDEHSHRENSNNANDLTEVGQTPDVELVTAKEGSTAEQPVTDSQEVDSISTKDESESDKDAYTGNESRKDEQENQVEPSEPIVEIPENKPPNIETTPTEKDEDEEKEKYNNPRIDNQEETEKNSDIPAKVFQQKGGKPIIPKKDRVGPPKLHHIPTLLDKMTHLMGADSPEQDTDDQVAPSDQTSKMEQTNDELPQASDSIPENGESGPEVLDSESESDQKVIEELDEKVETEDHEAPSDHTHGSGETTDEHSHLANLTRESNHTKVEQTPEAEKMVETEEKGTETNATGLANDDEHFHSLNSTVGGEQSEAEKTSEDKKPVETEENVAETDATRHINDDEHSHSLNSTFGGEQSQAEKTAEDKKPVETEENVAETDATRHINDDEHSHSLNSTGKGDQSDAERTSEVEKGVETEDRGAETDSNELPDEHSHSKSTVANKNTEAEQTSDVETSTAEKAEHHESSESHERDSGSKKYESESEKDFESVKEPNGHETSEASNEISEKKFQHPENIQQDEDDNEKHSRPETDNQEEQNLGKIHDIPTKGSQIKGGKPIIPKIDRVGPPKLHHIPTLLDKMTHLIGADSPEQDSDDHAPSKQRPEMGKKNDELSQGLDSVPGNGESEVLDSVPEKESEALLPEKGESESQAADSLSENGESQALDSVEENRESESQAMDSGPEKGESESDQSAMEVSDKKLETEDQVAPSDQTHEMGEANDEHSHSSNTTVTSELSEAEQTPDVEKPVETEKNVAPSDQTHEMGETNDEHSHSSISTVAKEKPETELTPEVEKPVETENHVAPSDQTHETGETNDEHSHSSISTVANNQAEADQTADADKKVETEETVVETNATRHINDDEHSHLMSSTVARDQSEAETEKLVEVETNKAEGDESTPEKVDDEPSDAQLLEADSGSPKDESEAKQDSDAEKGPNEDGDEQEAETLEPSTETAEKKFQHLETTQNEEDQDNNEKYSKPEGDKHGEQKPGNIKDISTKEITQKAGKPIIPKKDRVGPPKLHHIPTLLDKMTHLIGAASPEHDSGEVDKTRRQSKLKRGNPNPSQDSENISSKNSAYSGRQEMRLRSSKWIDKNDTSRLTETFKQKKRINKTNDDSPFSSRPTYRKQKGKNLRKQGNTKTFNESGSDDTSKQFKRDGSFTKNQTAVVKVGDINKQSNQGKNRTSKSRISFHITPPMKRNGTTEPLKRKREYDKVKKLPLENSASNAASRKNKTAKLPSARGTEKGEGDIRRLFNNRSLSRKNQSFITFKIQRGKDYSSTPFIRKDKINNQIHDPHKNSSHPFAEKKSLPTSINYMRDDEGKRVPKLRRFNRTYYAPKNVSKTYRKRSFSAEETSSDNLKEFEQSAKTSKVSVRHDPKVKKIRTGTKQRQSGKIESTLKRAKEIKTNKTSNTIGTSKLKSKPSGNNNPTPGNSRLKRNYRNSTVIESTAPKASPSKKVVVPRKRFIKKTAPKSSNSSARSATSAPRRKKVAPTQSVNKKRRRSSKRSNNSSDAKSPGAEDGSKRKMRFYRRLRKFSKALH